MPSTQAQRRTGNVRFDCWRQSVVTGGVVSKFAMNCVPPRCSRPRR